MPHTLCVLILSFISLICDADNFTRPPLTLAKTYKGQVNLTHYWVSEKLDGVRAYWDGQQLISRQGNPYPAPQWFIKDFPEQALDGELWLQRGRFQQLLSIVSKNQAIDKEWQQVSYHIFDLPHIEKAFSQRLDRLKQLAKKNNSPYLKLVHQYRVADPSALTQELNRIVAAGAEGLMLHHADAFYHVGRNDDLLKVKPYYDAEATVIAHLPGKGKFSGMLGSIQVEMRDGIQFRIGSGFSNQQRRTPPAIGSTITYSYHGKTDKGIPRFASFLRTRINSKLLPANN